jgi:hypothetical protein
MTEIEQMAELAYKFACDIMVGSSKELMAMFVIQRGGDKKHIDVIATPFRDDNEKRTMVINVALEIADQGCDAWSFLTESWFAHRTKDEPLGVRPMDDPNRKEGVICLASDGTTTLLHSWETERDEKGNCVRLVKYDEGDKFESWISQALNRAKKLHDEFPSGIDQLAREVTEELKKQGKL